MAHAATKSGLFLAAGAWLAALAGPDHHRSRVRHREKTGSREILLWQKVPVLVLAAGAAAAGLIVVGPGGGLGPRGHRPADPCEVTLLSLVVFPPLASAAAVLMLVREGRSARVVFVAAAAVEVMLALGAAGAAGGSATAGSSRWRP